MEARLKPVRTATIGILALALFAAAPWEGWWTLTPIPIAAVLFAIAGRGVERSARPEFWVGAAWLISQLMIAASIAVAGGPRSSAVSVLVILVVTLPARFGVRGVATGVTISALLMLAVTLGVDPAYVVSYPPALVFPMALLASVTALSTALMRSDLEHRTESVLDALTGMLNRRALSARMSELDEQARLTGETVGVVVGDVDRFKLINDRHGHARGDAVLVDVAYALRKQMRAFDLAYRIGGEEFLILLPGASREDAVVLAERLREAIAAEPNAGLDVTMSFGVATTDGQSVADTMLRADQALYAAKAAGRDCVRIAGAVAHAAPHAGDAARAAAG
jgi:diguanylate cyclase (GGDEF)-like protein